MTIIAKIIFCLIAAAILGFIIGWIFSSLIKNEKHQSQILAVRERFDEQKAIINQLETEIDAKDREMSILKEKHTAMEKEMLSYDMDSGRDELSDAKIADLEAENLLLLEQIKEQKICEDEKDHLQSELKQLENEKQNLINKIEELKEFEISYKENIHKIAELESKQKRDEKDFIKTDKTVKNKRKKNKSIKAKDISDAICKDEHIISNKNSNLAGNKDDKISEIIKNLFSNEKPNTKLNNKKE